MLDITLLTNFGKFVVSKDFRDSVSGLYGAYKESFSSRNLLITENISMRISKSDKIKVSDALDSVSYICRRESFTDQNRSRIVTCAAELIQNGLDHGCKSDGDEILVILDLKDWHLRLSVRQTLPIPDKLRQYIKKNPVVDWEYFNNNCAIGWQNILASCNDIQIKDNYTIVTFQKNRRSEDFSSEKSSSIDAFSSHDAVFNIIPLFNGLKINVLEIIGNVNHLNIDFLEDRFEEIFNESTIVDLRNCDSFPSGAMRFVLKAQLTLGKTEKKIVLCADRSSHVWETWKIAKFDALVSVVFDFDEAINSLS